MFTCACARYGRQDCVTVDVLIKAVKDNTIARIRGIHNTPSMAEIIALFDAVAYNTSLTRISYYFFSFASIYIPKYLKPKQHYAIACSLAKALCINTSVKRFSWWYDITPDMQSMIPFARMMSINVHITCVNIIGSVLKNTVRENCGSLKYAMAIYASAQENADPIKLRLKKKRLALWFPIKRLFNIY
jgi:hypothetical protein